MDTEQQVDQAFLEERDQKVAPRLVKKWIWVWVWVWCLFRWWRKPLLLLLLVSEYFYYFLTSSSKTLPNILANPAHPQSMMINYHFIHHHYHPTKFSFSLWNVDLPNIDHWQYHWHPSKFPWTLQYNSLWITLLSDALTD